MAVTAVATSGCIPATGTDRSHRMVEKTPGSRARTSDPCATRPAHKPGKPRPLREPAVTALPGQTLSLSLGVTRSRAVRLLDWPYQDPLALPTVIRTVNLVLPNGATLGPGIRTVALQPCPTGPDTATPPPNRDRAQA